jgi:hypothetical protein
MTRLQAISARALLGTGLLLSLAALQSGCAHKPPVNESAKPFLDEPHVTGPWSEVVNGMTCRILIDSSAADENGKISAAMELWNTGDKTIRLRDGEHDALGSGNLVWLVGKNAFYTAPGESKTPTLKKKSSELTLRPDERYVVGPVPLRVSIAAAPNGGLVGISASFPVDEHGEKRLAAPSVQVAANPSQWGAADKSVRTCVAAADETVEPTQALRLFLYAQNNGGSDLKLPPFDWRHPRVQTTRNRVTVTYEPARAAEPQRQQAGTVQRQVLEIPDVLTQPGVYRVCVVLDGAAHSDEQLWSGRAVSNEITVRVRE